MVPACWSPLAAGLALAWALTPPALAAAPATPETKAKADSPSEKIKKALDQTISLDITEQPLHLAINQLREQTKINFVLDRFTIQQMGIDPESAQVTVKLKDVKARTALRMILNSYNLSFAIIGDTVLISTDDMAMFRQMRQRVNLDVDKVEIAKAIKQLARDTATNLIIDNRAAKEAQTAVTLQMDDVPLETAVRLMAEMAGLKPVRVGNVLFVTTKANANEMRQDPDLAPNPQPGNPRAEMMMMMGGGMPGMPGGPGGAPVIIKDPATPAPGDSDKLETEKKEDKKDEKKSDDKKPTDAKPVDKLPPPKDQP
jgi:hypothetical protein